MLKRIAKHKVWRARGIIHCLRIATGTYLCIMLSLWCVACVWDPRNCTVPESWTLNFLMFLSQTHNINVTAFCVCFQFLCYFSGIFVLAGCCSSGSLGSCGINVLLGVLYYLTRVVLCGVSWAWDKSCCFRLGLQATLKIPTLSYGSSKFLSNCALTALCLAVQTCSLYFV